MIFIIVCTNTKPANFRAFQRHTIALASFGLKPTQAGTQRLPESAALKIGAAVGNWN